MKTYSIPAILCFSLLAFKLVSIAHAQTTNADFQQAVADYTKSPNLAAAEKVIKLAAAMTQLPPIPEEARKHFVRGGTLFKDAKTPEDLKQVADEFRQAAYLAPWWPEARYNQALAYETAGNYTNALEILKLYQLFKLSEAEARAVQDKIYAVELKQEKAAKEAQLAQQQKQMEDQRARAEQAARAERERFNTFVGGWRITSFLVNGVSSREHVGTRTRIEKEGGVYHTFGISDLLDAGTFRLSGRDLIGTLTPSAEILHECVKATPLEVLQQAAGKVTLQCRMTLSDDGKMLSVECEGGQINYTKGPDPFWGNLSTVYTYTSFDRIPSFFVLSLTRDETAPPASQLKVLPPSQRKSVTTPNRTAASSSSRKTASATGCFIATAAYGSPLEAHVMKLRMFRDRFLLKSTVGTRLVECYYQCSPELARFIETRPVAKFVTRQTLKPVIWFAGACLGSITDLVSLAVFCGCVVAAFRLRKHLLECSARIFKRIGTWKPADKIHLIVIAGLAVGFASVCQSQAQTGNPQDTLRQSIADLQKNPADTALREKIIKLTLTMSPRPAVPDEVATHEGAAEYAFKNAKTVADYADAAKEFEKALLAAPWLAADYFNCGVAHEKAGNFEAAIRNFNLYLFAAPEATDATDVRKRIGAVQYQAEKAAKDAELAKKKAADEARAQAQKKAEAEAAAARQRQIEEARRNSFEGTWMRSGDDTSAFVISQNAAANYAVTLNIPNREPTHSVWANVNGRNINFKVPVWDPISWEYTLTLSSDGQSANGTWWIRVRGSEQNALPQSVVFHRK